MMTMMMITSLTARTQLLKLEQNTAIITEIVSAVSLASTYIACVRARRQELGPDDVKRPASRHCHSRWQVR